MIAVSANGLLAEPEKPRPSFVPLLKVAEAPSTSWQLRQNGSSAVLVSVSQLVFPLIQVFEAPVMLSLS